MRGARENNTDTTSTTMGYKNKKYQLYNDTESSQYSTMYKQKKIGLGMTSKNPAKMGNFARERNSTSQARNNIRDRQRKLKYQHSLQDDIAMLSLQPSTSSSSISSHTPTRNRGNSSAYATPTKPRPVTTNSPFNTTITPGTLTPLKVAASTSSLASSFSTSTSMNSVLSPRTKSNVQHSVISYLFSILFPNDQNHNISNFHLPTAGPPVPPPAEEDHQYDHFYDDEEDDDSVISITPVDVKWFQQLLLSHFLADYENSIFASASILQASTKAIPENATLSALLDDFLPPFISNMIFAIYFDNNYIVSPKVAVLKALYKNYPESRTIIMRNVSNVLHTYNNNTGEVATSPLEQIGSGDPPAAVGFQVLELMEFIVSYDTFLRQSKIEDSGPSQDHLQQSLNMISSMIVYFKYSKSTTNELFEFVNKILTIYSFNSSQEYYDHLLRLLLRSCPQHNAVVVVGFMKLLTVVLSYYPHVIPPPPPPTGSLLVNRSYPTSPLVHKSLVKLLDQATSSHFKVSTEAINIVTSDVMLCKYMLVDYPAEPSKFYLKALIARLVSNKKHWNIIVRELSETKYDMLLDYY